MKIKRERQVRLDELLRLVWNGEVKEGVYAINGLGRAHVNLDELILINRNHVTKSDLFTITEEVEIDEETKLNLVYINGYNKSYTLFNSSIKDVFEEWGNVAFTNNRPKFIYLQNDDGSIGELIWSKERGLID